MRAFFSTYILFEYLIDHPVKIDKYFKLKRVFYFNVINGYSNYRK